MHSRRLLAAALVVLGWTVLGWTALAQGKDLALISNKSNEVVTITLPELVKVCKGQVSRWPDGKPVSFITRDPAAPEMKLLLEKVYGMSKDEVKATIASANHGRADHPAIVVVESMAQPPNAANPLNVPALALGVSILMLGPLLFVLTV